mgnify:CR=1 FL=1
MFTKYASEFRAFISRGNVIDLAVGIIMGAAFTAIVNSLVQDVILPPIGWLMGNLDFSSFFLALNGEQYPTIKAAPPLITACSSTPLSSSSSFHLRSSGWSSWSTASRRPTQPFPSPRPRRKNC